MTCAMAPRTLLAMSIFRTVRPQKAYNKNLKTNGSSTILNNYEAEINNYFNFSIFVFNDQEYIDNFSPKALFH